MVTVTHTHPVVQRLQWMSVRRTTVQVVDVPSKNRPRRCKLVIDCSVGFCMSLANSFVENDRSGRSCDKYAALITTLRYCLVCNASNCGDVINTSSSLFLTDEVVTPLRTFQINNLTVNSACRGSGSYSIQLLSPSEFNARIDSRFSPPAQLHSTLLRHPWFQNGPPCATIKASNFSLCSNAGLLTPVSNPI